MPSSAARPFTPLLDQRVLARRQGALRACRSGRRPPLSTAELQRFGAELRPGAHVDLHVPELERPDRVMIVARFNPASRASALLAVLTPREREVALLIADGLTHREIAQRLTLSVSTVKDHVHRILFRMKVTSRLAVAQAVLTSRHAGAASDDC